MPQIRLNFPPPSNNRPAANGSAAIPVPAVELQLSLFERIQDWYNYHFRLEHAKAVGVHREMWCRGITEEVRFWDDFLRTRGFNWPEQYAERFNPDLPLQQDLAELINAPAGATVRILDVGAGPLTWVGRKSPRWKVAITAVDPLADAYDQLMRNHGVTPPVRTVPGTAEGLRKRFARNSFDLATARNSLDHAIDPADALRQMVTLVKPGAAILLSHAVREATNNAWSGLHQWDFDLVNGEFVISSLMERVNVHEMLDGQATVSSTLAPDGSWFNTVIRRKS